MSECVTPDLLDRLAKLEAAAPADVLARLAKLEKDHASMVALVTVLRDQAKKHQQVLMNHQNVLVNMTQNPKKIIPVDGGSGLILFPRQT